MTLEPCAHHGRTPPCADAVVAAGIARVVVGALDPNPKAAGGAERLRGAGVEVDARRLARGAAAERGVAHVGRARPAVRRRTRPRSRSTGACRSRPRWVTRRGVAPARARAARGRRTRSRSGMGTVRADDPRLDARDVGAARQPRRLAFGHGRCRRARARAAQRPARGRAAALAADGVQSLLLEGGPTLATAFVAAGLVDKLLLFVAPILAGDGPALPRRPPGAGRRSTRPHARAGRRGRAPRAPTSTSPEGVACDAGHPNSQAGAPERAQHVLGTQAEGRWWTAPPRPQGVAAADSATGQPGHSLREDNSPGAPQHRAREHARLYRAPLKPMRKSRSYVWRCSRASCASAAGSRPSSGDAGSLGRGAGDAGRRVGDSVADQRRLPDGRRSRRRRSPSTPSPRRSRARRSAARRRRRRQRRARAARRRAARRPHRPGHVDGVGRRSIELEGDGLPVWSTRRRTCCATASRRARSRSTAPR